jgi:hypothetical protein
MALRLVSWWLLALVPLAAFAADQAVHSIDPGAPRFWVALGAVQVLSLVGYAASSLPQWAGWIKDTGGPVAVLERRLKIVQGMVIALLAGNCAYYGGHHYWGLAEILAFGTAAMASYGGDKFLSPLMSRIATMFQAAFGKTDPGG